MEIKACHGYVTIEFLPREGTYNVEFKQDLDYNVINFSYKSTGVRNECRNISRIYDSNEGNNGSVRPYSTKEP